MTNLGRLLALQFMGRGAAPRSRRASLLLRASWSCPTMPVSLTHLDVRAVDSCAATGGARVGGATSSAPTREASASGVAPVGPSCPGSVASVRSACRARRCIGTATTWLAVGLAESSPKPDGRGRIATAPALLAAACCVGWSSSGARRPSGCELLSQLCDLCGPVARVTHSRREPEGPAHFRTRPSGHRHCTSQLEDLRLTPVQRHAACPERQGRQAGEQRTSRRGAHGPRRCLQRSRRFWIRRVS
jgi:hypothetical protein